MIYSLTNRGNLIGYPAECTEKSKLIHRNPGLELKIIKRFTIFN